MKTMRDPKRRPTHPGAVLREDVLPALGVTQAEFAAALGVHRVTLSALLRERRGLTVELAARIAKVLGHSPESWLRMQEAVDLWELGRHPERLAGVRPIPQKRRMPTESLAA
jgi:addiction module HigA family antidote